MHIWTRGLQFQSVAESLTRIKHNGKKGDVECSSVDGNPLRATLLWKFSFLSFGRIGRSQMVWCPSSDGEISPFIFCIGEVTYLKQKVTLIHKQYCYLSSIFSDIV